MTGEKNSSVTRVRPLFECLLERNEQGTPWLGELLTNAPGGRELVSPELLEAPGQLLPEVTERRSSGQLAGLRNCFEHDVPAPAELLSWLLRNPRELNLSATELADSAKTERYRLALATEDWRVRDPAIREGLRLLAEYGPPASKPVPWWAFEGPTSVDCWLETDRLILFIEGKRTESLSVDTRWIKGRNQLIRNLETVGQEANGKPCFVLLAVESVVDDDPAKFRSAAPHLSEDAYLQLWSRYLGQRTWEELTASLRVPRDRLLALGWN